MYYLLSVCLSVCVCGDMASAGSREKESRGKEKKVKEEKRKAYAKKMEEEKQKQEALAQAYIYSFSSSFFFFLMCYSSIFLISPRRRKEEEEEEKRGNRKPICSATVSHYRHTTQCSINNLGKSKTEAKKPAGKPKESTSSVSLCRHALHILQQSPNLELNHILTVSAREEDLFAHQLPEASALGLQGCRAIANPVRIVYDTFDLLVAIFCLRSILESISLTTLLCLLSVRLHFPPPLRLDPLCCRTSPSATSRYTIYTARNASRRPSYQLAQSRQTRRDPVGNGGHK